MQVRRTIRKSDATLTLEGVRYDVPARFGHFPQLILRYSRWDRGRVYIVDERTGKPVARIFPLDRARHAGGERRALAPPSEEPPSASSGEFPPLLKRLVEDYAADGLPPAYLPTPRKDDGSCTASNS